MTEPRVLKPWSHESADVVDGDVGETECLGLRHPAIGYLGNFIDEMHAHLLDGLLPPEYGTEVNVHIVLHHEECPLIGGHFQHGGYGISRWRSTTSGEYNHLTAGCYHRSDRCDVETVGAPLGWDVYRLS